MEDPWSTPWAVETPSASPGLAPTKPKAAAPLPGTGTITPTEGGLGIGGGFDHSPWGAATVNGFDMTHTPKDENDDQSWGGWDDGKHNAWAGNPNDDAGTATLKEPAGEFSAPWGSPDTEQDHRIGGAADSAVSFGDQAKQEAKPVPAGAAKDDTKQNATMLLEDEQDAWTAPRGDVAAPSEAIADDAKSPTPDKGPEHLEEPKMIADVAKSVPRNDSTEELKPGSQAQQQKASKVQELVDMYDGIAKKTVCPPPDIVSRESRSSGSAAASQEELTTQDSLIEEHPSLDTEKDSKVVQEDEDVSASTKTEAPGTKDLAVAEDIPAFSADAIDEETISALVEAKQDTKSNAEATTRSAYDEQQLLKNTTSDTSHPPYPIDLSNLEALFPGSTPSTTNPEPVPDVIIDNSYTTTSERRTWYRISRFGSTRKHDSGEEDNYKRITWATSEVRTKTLHIVRRWMEQDSITGRVVLGSRKAGPLGASMFNWDSSEPQIEISELLRQRVQKGGASSGGGHARNRSLPQADLPPQTPTMEEFGGGWGANASMPSTPSAVVQSPRFAAQIKERAGSALRPPPDSPAEMPRSPWDDDDKGTEQERKSLADLMPPPPLPATADATVAESSIEPAIAEPEPAKAAEEEDEDDWGEMVSSPVVNSSAAFAPLSAPAEVKPKLVQESFEADFSGVDFFEPPAPKLVRANPPAPILTSGMKAAAPSPIWTPTMNSPALEPVRVSVENVRTQSAVGTPTMVSTPVPEPPRTSINNNRMSMERVWTPVVSTPTTNNRLSVESAWTPVADSPISSAAPSAEEAKLPLGERVSFEDTCTVGEKAAIEEALRSLPDLSYMLC